MLASTLDRNAGDKCQPLICSKTVSNVKKKLVSEMLAIIACRNPGNMIFGMLANIVSRNVGNYIFPKYWQL